MKGDAMPQVYPGMAQQPMPDVPFIASMKLLVADKARCVTHLKSAGMAVHDIQRGCLVPPGDANGVILELVEG